jgi:uncharacterized protein
MIKRLIALVLCKIQKRRDILNHMEREEIVLAALAPGRRHLFTPVQVQKLMFLIDREIPTHVGGPHFHFEPYHYGPFDGHVYRVLAKLASIGLVTIDESYPPRTYALTPDGLERGLEILNNLRPEVKAFVEQVCAFVRTNSFSSLVSAIYKAYPDMRVNSVFQH